MKKLSLEQMEKIEGGNFPWWGTYCDYENPGPPQYLPVGDGTHQEEFCEYQCAYYVMGVKVEARPSTLEACPTVNF